MIAFADPISDPTAIAERLTGRSYLSWSAISTYLRCPLKYRYLCGQLHKYCYVASGVMWRSTVCPNKNRCESHSERHIMARITISAGTP